MDKAINILEPIRIDIYEDYYKFLTKNGKEPCPEKIQHYYIDHNGNRICLGEQMVIVR